LKDENINSPQELFNELKGMNENNSVTQFQVPGKGRFTIVYQEGASVQEEIDADEERKDMISESMEAYKKGDYQSTFELLKSLSERAVGGCLTCTNSWFV
jgi:hypothetical protein